MMAGPALIFVVALACSVFLTASWNAGQAAVVRGMTRAKHLTIVLLVVMLLAGLGLGAPPEVIRLWGAALAGASVWLAAEEDSRAGRVYCAVQGLCGLTVAAGLPFAAL